jgi:cobalt-zinc-cadmium efflux system membrane fusion protein
MTPFESSQGVGRIEARTDTHPALPAPSAPVVASPEAPPARWRIWRYALMVLVLLVLAAAAGWVTGFYDRFDLFDESAGITKQPQTDALAVSLVPGRLDTISVPEQVREALGIKEAAEAKVPAQGEPLVMPGSTALDPARIMRVKTRFNAEVVSIGEVSEPGPNGVTVTRELRPGDEVRKGQTLAVVWSIDVGGKKSDLVDALVQLRLDEGRLEARKKLFEKGYLPEDTLRQTERDVISGRNAVERAVRTLRTWRVPEREIDEAREEAEKTLARKGKRDREKEELWARSELVAPRDGTLVERNVGVGEYVADNTINLFTIADVSRMLVVANPPEDALPTLLALPSEKRYWMLQTVGAEKLTGRIDEISYILDPNQHTAVVKGYINNPDRRLRAGQFVRATVELPPPPDVVEVPINALVEDGPRSYLFIQSDAAKHQYTLRRVLVSQRFEKKAFVKSRLMEAEKQVSPEDKSRGVQPCQPLRPGERFLVAGVLELRSALEDLLLKTKER